MCQKIYKLFCNQKELQLKGTLNGGQSFRWKNIKKDNGEEWVGVFSNRVWILQQFEDHIAYRVIEPDNYNKSAKKIKTEYDYEGMLRNYFHLHYSLQEYYPKWSKSDPYFDEASKQFYGIRILKQDVTENIFSFICSSNNNIARISGMVEKLAKFYGSEIGTYDDTVFHSFPSVEALAQAGVEETLRKNGFGYRSKYISRSAEMIMNQGGQKWLDELTDMDYADAKKSLMTLTGIGAKVADCICLMSLGHLQAIPVDTHIYQIAQRFYLPKLAKQKTVTEKIYNEIGDHFRELYGPLAGWAHTVLFCADLKKFQDNEEPQKKKKKR